MVDINNHIPTIDIHGSCVTRDAFEHVKERYQVVTYISRNSIFATTFGVVPLNDDDYECQPNYLKRMVSCDFNKKTFELLGKSKSDYFILDLIDERFNLLQFTGKASGVITNSSNFRKSTILSNHPTYSQAKVSLIYPEEWDENFFQSKIDLYCEQIKSIYPPDRLIVHYATCAGHYQNKSGKICKFSDKYLKEAKELNTKIGKIYQSVISNLGNPSVIKLSKYCIADENHKWGLAPFHYTPLYYGKFIDELDKIIFNNTKGL